MEQHSKRQERHCSQEQGQSQPHMPAAAPSAMLSAVHAKASLMRSSESWRWRIGRQTSARYGGFQGFVKIVSEFARQIPRDVAVAVVRQFLALIV